MALCVGYMKTLKMAAFWDIAPCCLVEVDQLFTYYLHYQSDEYSRTSETSVNFYETTRRNIPQCYHLHTRRRENLKSHLYARVIQHQMRWVL
jgi:hypothetical protein